MKRPVLFLLIGLIGIGILATALVTLWPEWVFAPQVVSVEPADGFIAREGTLQIVFNQRMDHEAVESAFRIEPAVPGTFEWRPEGRGERLIFRPARPLDLEQTYTVTLEATAANRAGRRLAQPLTVRLQTGRAVAVVSVFPEPGADGVPVDTSVVVRFDRPVVQQVVSFDQQADLPQPIALEPSVPGLGRWLAPDTFAFYPQESLQPGTTYRVVVGPDVGAQAALETPYRWQFTTEGIQVVAAVPFDGAEEVEPTAQVVVKFSRPVAPDLVAPHFRLEDESGRPVAGELRWEDGEGEAGYRTLVFVPAERLRPASAYHIRLEAPAGNPLAPFQATFATVDLLRVEAVQPAPGAVEVSIVPSDTLISVQFNHPVVPLVGRAEQRKLPVPVEIDPPVAGEGEWLTTSLFVFHPAEPLRPSTEYRVTVRPDLTDMLGIPLAELYTWRFTTVYPAVVGVEPEGPENLITASGPITVTFNQPMDPESVAQHLRITLGSPDGQPVEGRIEWPDPQRLVFTPARPLPRGEPVFIVVTSGAQGAAGGEMRKPFTARREVAPLPAVIKTEPRDGAPNVDPFFGLRLIFNVPMDTEQDAAEFLEVQPPPSQLFANWDYSDPRTLYVWPAGGLQPSSPYTVTVKPGLRSALGETLAEPYTFRFTTRALPPLVDLLGGSFRASTYATVTPTLQVVAYRNVPEVTLRLYRVGPDEAVRLLADWETWYGYRGRSDQLLHEWTLTNLEAEPNTVGLAKTLIPPESGRLEPGVYYLEARAPGVREPARRVAVASPYNLVLKRSPGQVLVWVTDLETARPVADIRVAVYTSNGSKVAEGRTDQNGLFTGSYSERQSDPWNPFVALALDEEGNILGAVTDEWNEGAQPWMFQLSVNMAPPDHRAVIYTDRPLYRPGQTVYFRGIVRQDRDGVFSPLRERAVTVAVRDPERGEVVYRAELPLTPYGTFSGQIELPEEAAIGFYSFTFERPKLELYDIGGFSVAEYRRPEFQVTVTPSAEEVVQGQPLTATVEAAYFFGGAVSNAEVRWRVLRAPFYFSAPLPGYWSWQDYDDELAFFAGPTDFFSAELVAEGTGTLDAQGRFTVEVPTDLSEFNRSQRFTVEADVEDVNGQVVSGRAVVVVHQGAFYVGTRAAEFVGQAGEPLDFEVRLVQPDGTPWTEATPVRLEFARREWYSVREEREDGQFYWTTRFTDTVEATQVVTTDANGAARVTFTPPQGGVYTLLARATDPQGNEVRSRTFVWVSDREYVSWRQENNRALELVSDQRTYRPGDVARILVPTPVENMTALVTVERGDVRSARVVRLPTNSETLEVLITGDMAPNVYVSVVAVKGFGPQETLPDIRMGYVALNVEPVEQTLDIRITPHAEGPFSPREVVTFTVEVRDSAGRPVQAELSAALVDKALLSLAREPVSSLADVFYGPRPLSVMTGGTLFVNADLANQALAPGAKGGGGGGGGLGFPLEIRQEFPETAFWRAHLETDDQGRVTFAVRLPDTLTTWVLTVRAVDRETRVGDGRYEIRTTLPFFVRLLTPRFFVVGDEATVQAVVHNNTEDDLSAHLTLEAEGVELLDGSGREVSVSAGGREMVTFRLRALGHEGETSTAAFRLYADAPGHQDALAFSVPVYSLTAPEVVATFGVLEEGESTAVEQIVVPADVDPRLGGLTVEVAPSLAGATQSALKYLRIFPYFCTEQVVSAFLPDVMTYRAIRQAGLARADLEAPLKEAMAVAVQRLVATQNLDGGWGWWAGDDSHPWLTAYALLGLVEAQREGVAVAENTVTRAQTYLVRWLARTAERDDRSTLNTRAFVLYVLAHTGNPDVGRTVQLYETRARLDVEGLAFLGLALAELGEEQREAVQTVVNDLIGRARLSATGIFWEEEEPDLWSMSSSVRATSLVLALLSRGDSPHFLAPQVVRWLMTARKAEHWETTQETAWAVMALTDYMVASRELEANFAYEVTLNDAVIAEGVATRNTVTETRRLEVDLEKLMLDQANRLVIARRPTAAGQPAPGRLYYAAWLRAFRPAEGIPEKMEGISVARRYEQVDPVTLRPTGAPVEELHVGDVVQVHLTVMAPNDLYFFVLEDPLPAGFEAIDPTLLASPSAAPGPTGRQVEAAGRPRFWFDGWTRREIRDEKVALFSTLLSRGTYEYTYLARVTTAGTFTALPAVAYEMYRPEVYGRSASQQVQIAP